MMDVMPWETPEFKAKMAAEYEADAPHFHCDECLEINPTYLGLYSKPDGAGQICHQCAEKYYGDDGYSDGEEWKWKDPADFS